MEKKISAARFWSSCFSRPHRWRQGPLKRGLRAAACRVVLLVVLGTTGVFGQNTELTYQGQLQNSGAPANGNFDFEFLLFDAGGAQIGPTLARSGVTVANGIFSVNLDFGSSFPGASRFLEIRVRQGGGAFTTLSPRQSVTSAPYSVKSLTANTADNATNATNAVNANNAVTANSASTAINFTGNLSGDVTGTQNATTVARIQNRNVASTAPTGGQVLKYNTSTNQWTPDTDNTGSGGGTITGVNPGTGLTGGGTTGSVTLGIAPNGISSTEIANNAVTDTKIANGAVTATKIQAGQVVKNINGLTDAVTLAGGSNIIITPTGNTLTIASTTVNAILNQTAQQPNANFNISGAGTIGSSLTVNGTVSAAVVQATRYDIAGNAVLRSPSENLFVGVGSGTAAPIGLRNVYIGDSAGSLNASGSDNVFVGTDAGRESTSSANSFFGVSAGFNTTADGNSFFGRSAGLQNRSGANNSYFGRQAGRDNQMGNDNAYFGYQAGIGSSGSSNSYFGKSAGDNSGTTSNNTAIGANSDVIGFGFGTAIGAGTVLIGTNRVQLGRAGMDDVAFGKLSSAGTNTTVCFSGNEGIILLAQCGSSLRYKENIRTSRYGLALVRRLRPVVFDWRDNGETDLGLIAEEVAKIEPRLSTYNSDGRVQGVKYDQLTAVLINAVKEQQKVIEHQRRQITRLETAVFGRNQRKHTRGRSK